MNKLAVLAETLDTIVPHTPLPINGKRWTWEIQSWKCFVDTRHSLGVVLKVYSPSEWRAQFMRVWPPSGPVRTTVLMATSIPLDIQCIALLVDAIVQYHMSADV